MNKKNYMIPILVCTIFMSMGWGLIENSFPKTLENPIMIVDQTPSVQAESNFELISPIAFGNYSQAPFIIVDFDCDPIRIVSLKYEFNISTGEYKGIDLLQHGNIYSTIDQNRIDAVFDNSEWTAQQIGRIHFKVLISYIDSDLIFREIVKEIEINKVEKTSGFDFQILSPIAMVEYNNPPAIIIDFLENISQIKSIQYKIFQTSEEIFEISLMEIEKQQIAIWVDPVKWGKCGEGSVRFTFEITLLSNVVIREIIIVQKTSPASGFVCIFGSPLSTQYFTGQTPTFSLQILDHISEIVAINYIFSNRSGQQLIQLPLELIENHELAYFISPDIWKNNEFYSEMQIRFNILWKDSISSSTWWTNSEFYSVYKVADTPSIEIFSSTGSNIIQCVDKTPIIKIHIPTRVNYLTVCDSTGENLVAEFIFKYQPWTGGFSTMMFPNILKGLNLTTRTLEFSIPQEYFLTLSLGLHIFTIFAEDYTGKVLQASFALNKYLDSPVIQWELNGKKDPSDLIYGNEAKIHLLNNPLFPQVFVANLTISLQKPIPSLAEIGNCTNLKFTFWNSTHSITDTPLYANDNVMIYPISATGSHEPNQSWSIGEIQKFRYQIALDGLWSQLAEGKYNLSVEFSIDYYGHSERYSDTIALTKELTPPVINASLAISENGEIILFVNATDAQKIVEIWISFSANSNIFLTFEPGKELNLQKSLTSDVLNEQIIYIYVVDELGNIATYRLMVQEEDAVVPEWLQKYMPIAVFGVSIGAIFYFIQRKFKEGAIE